MKKTIDFLTKTRDRWLSQGAPQSSLNEVEEAIAECKRASTERDEAINVAAVARESIAELDKTVVSLRTENRRLTEDLEHRGKIINNVNDHLSRLTAKQREAAELLRRWRKLYADLDLPDHEDGRLFSESGSLAGTIEGASGKQS